MCSSAPDMSGVNEAAKMSAELGNKALDWYTKKYEEQAPLREQTAKNEQAVADAQLEAMRTNTQTAKDYDTYNKSTFRPLEKSIVADANSFNTEDKQNELAGKAVGDVKQAASAARAETGRAMARSGINLSDPKYASMLLQTGNQEALAQAGAGTKARSDAITLGHAFKMDAASLGRGLPSSQATSAQIAMNAGDKAAATGAMPLTQAQQAAAQVGAGYQTAIGGQQTAGNLYGQAANIQTQSDAANAGIWGALGQGVGMWAGGGFKGLR